MSSCWGELLGCSELRCRFLGEGSYDSGTGKRCVIVDIALRFVSLMHSRTLQGAALATGMLPLSDYSIITLVVADCAFLSLGCESMLALTRSEHLF